MALVIKDRVKETTSTTGTGTITLAGAVSGFQSFSVIGNGNSTFYTIAGVVSGKLASVLTRLLALRLAGIRCFLHQIQVLWLISRLEPRTYLLLTPLVSPFLVVVGGLWLLMKPRLPRITRSSPVQMPNLSAQFQLLAA